MFDHHHNDDLLWQDRRDRLTDAGRLSHLVFVDGRLVDAWSERVEGSTYADVARLHDEDRRPHVVQSPPPPPGHVQALAWLAAGIAWVVGKANAAIGPEGPVTQVRIADRLGTTSLNACGTQVLGHVRRLGWNSARPWACGAPAVTAVGRVELLSATVRRDLVELRDRSLADLTPAL